MEERSSLYGQSNSNKQGREGELSEEEAKRALSRINSISKQAYGVYKYLLNEAKKKDPDRIGLTRELARTVLPVNYFTEFYWKIDLHNLMHFLALRSDSHAQFEIRAYANVMLDTLKRWVPLTYEAFVEHRLGGTHLSASALSIVQRMVQGEVVTQEDSGLSKGEWRELRAALGLED